MKKSEGSFYYGYVVTITCFVILLIVFGIHYTFGLYLKPILAEFGGSTALISGAYSISWLIQGPSSLVMGKLNDRYGPRMVLSLCAVLLFLGIFLTTRISASWQLYFSYGLFTGVGTGGIYVPIVSTIARWFTTRRATMTGIAISGMGFGTFLISPAAHYLITNYSWRTSYTIFGIILLFVTVIAARFLQLGPDSTRVEGAVSSKGDKREIREQTRSGTLKEAFSQREFWKVFVMFFCFGFCLIAIMIHIAPHAIEVGISPGFASGLLAIIGITSIIGKVFFGYLGDRIGGRRVYIVGFTIMCLSLLIVVFSDKILLLYIFAILFGLAYGGNACSQSPLVAEMFGLKSHGAILGALNIGFTSGATVGPFVTGLLFDINGDYFVALWGVGIMCFIGFVFAISLRHKAQVQIYWAVK